MSGFMPPLFYNSQCVMIKCIKSLNFAFLFALTKSNSRSVYNVRATRIRLSKYVSSLLWLVKSSVRTLDELIEIFIGFIQSAPVNTKTLAQIGPHVFPPNNHPAI